MNLITDVTRFEFSTSIGTVVGLCSETHIVCLCFKEHEKLLCKFMFGKNLKHVHNLPMIAQKLKNQIDDFALGERTQFGIPIKLHGTDFQRSIWQLLADIPYGQTRTYSDIARSANKPHGHRAVARAIAHNPILLLVPCHRVVGLRGALTGYSGGLIHKQKILELESKNPSQQPHPVDAKDLYRPK